MQIEQIKLKDELKAAKGLNMTIEQYRKLKSKKK